ncbi:20088_t:CDS:1, partial [Entrophospora sp. SA101]
ITLMVTILDPHLKRFCFASDNQKIEAQGNSKTNLFRYKIQ